jgi:ATP-binding cassette, subfamily B, bacterial
MPIPSTPPPLDRSTVFRVRARESAHLFSIAIGMLWRVGPRLLVSLVAVLIGQALIVPVQLALTQRGVDDVAASLDHVSASRASTGSPELWLVLLALTLAVRSLMTPFASLFQTLLGDRVTAEVNAAVLRAGNSWPGIRRFEDPSFADDLQAARTKAARGGLELVSYGAQCGLAAFTAVGITIVLAGLHPWIPVVILGSQLPGMAMEWRFRDATAASLYTQSPQARRLRYLRGLATDPAVAKDVRLAGAFGFLRRRYLAIWTTAVGETAGLRRRLAARMVLARVLSSGVLVAVYVVLVRSAVEGHTTIGGLVYFGGAIVLLTQALYLIGFNVGYLPQVFSYLPSLQRILDAGPDLVLPARPTSMRAEPIAGVAFEDVYFTYPDTADAVLNGVSFRLDPGASLALVGHNGAGKTTIVKLLLRLYDPDAGRITFDGTDIRDLDIDEFRRRVGVIFQDFGRYELTVGENIGLGDISRAGDRARILEAARRGGAADFVDNLPAGLDTRLGISLGGRDISGGQWQRIALARAFMADSQLLVLDEPTAELDPRAEYEVFERFAELTAGRMTVLISHRFSTVRMADRIVVLEHGRVREEGTHDALLLAAGEYARMFDIQASQYSSRDPTDTGGHS